tara:strand:- start:315 stop:842 length:528 start_codon:yes stop_codon:yes gene_type:complete
MNNRRQIIWNYGLMMGLSLVLLYGVLYALGEYNLGDQSSSNWGQMLVNFGMAVVFPLLAMLKLKSIQNGYIKLGAAFSSGWQVILIASIIGSLWILVYAMILDPSYQDKIIEAAYDEWAKQGLGDDQMEQAESFTRMFTSPFMMAGMGIVSSALIGALISLVLGLIVQKQDPSEI